MLFLLHIFQRSRKHAAGSTGGGSDNRATGRVLLTDGKSVSADGPVFSGFGAFINMVLIVKKLCLPFDTETAAERTGC